MEAINGVTRCSAATGLAVWTSARVRRPPTPWVAWPGDSEKYDLPGGCAPRAGPQALGCCYSHPSSLSPSPGLAQITALG